MQRSCWLAALTLLLLAGSVPGQEKSPVRKALWSFQPVSRPALPTVRDAAWASADLDRFLLARLEAVGLKPNPDADRVTLIRRAALDLTGLPPTLEEIDAFLADAASDDEAFAKVVDRYLQSPRFGERWGRHWLDVVRFADSGGRSWNAPFTYAWRYRDYVIDAINKDKPYDRFIIEQLAGDLLPVRSVEEEREQRTATGFLALGSVNIQEGRKEAFVLDRVDDQIDVTTRAFLGLTVACARCHDHKYDPVTTRDYYALAGVFYSTKTLAGQGALADRNTEYVDARALVHLPALKGGGSEPAPGGVHSMSDFRAEYSTGKRDIRFTTDPNLAMGAVEGEVRDCAICIKGDPYKRDTAPPRGEVRIPGLPGLPKIPAGVSGRLELARWIASPGHPLTARVMANRVWLHLFGRGIVRTVDDFGSTGEAPSHPELLDHLAARFVDEGWSVKKLVRSIMLSRTYRLSSAGSKAGREKDPSNELYGRMNLRRLEMEVLRDGLLTAAGRLTLERPEGIQVAGIGGKGKGAVTHSLLGIDAPHRTVYLPVLRSLVPELYGAFDFPDPCQIMGQREVTTVAPQALFFLNSDLVVDCARKAAALLLKEAGLSEAERVRLAYRRLLGRQPEADEVKEALQLLSGVRQGSTEVYRWAALTQALMASAEFRYVR